MTERERRIAEGLALEGIGNIIGDPIFFKRGCLWDNETDSWLAPNKVVMDELLALGAKPKAAGRTMPMPMAAVGSGQPVQPIVLKTETTILNITPPKAVLTNLAQPGTLEGAVGGMKGIQTVLPFSSVTVPPLPKVSLPPITKAVDANLQRDDAKMQQAPQAPMPEAAPASTAEPQVQGYKAPEALKKLVLPPSILLGGAISVPGDVKYFNLNETTNEEEADGFRIGARTKTTQRVVRDTEGYEAAHRLAGELRRDIRSVSRATILGPMCSVKDEPRLDDMLRDVRRRAEEFNRTARYHFVRVALIKATIGSDDERAARELVFEIQSLMSELKMALDAADVKKIREVVVRAKAIEPVFPERERGVLQAAFLAAREAANTLRKASDDKVENIEAVKEALNLRAVDEARAMFLEFEIPQELAVASSAIEEARSAALELEAPLLAPVPGTQG
jgi:hypothetical protein